MDFDPQTLKITMVTMDFDPQTLKISMVTMDFDLPPGGGSCLERPPRGGSAAILREYFTFLKVKTVSGMVGARDFFVELDELYNFASWITSLA